MILKKACLLFVLTLCMQKIIAQEEALTDFKAAPMTQGQLPNGMHYYIMHNDNPKGRAAFYFAQNVGSILEEDTQRGLAHFLEHMAFNGTQHFKNKEMLDYLEKNGIKFGTEINAFTTYDETVYNIRNVPVENKRLLDSVLLVLHDWSGYLTLSDEEIDNERGVVREEWRTRYNARIRARDSIEKNGLLIGSKYENRATIGTMEVIDNFKYDELRNYYKKWYRPDLQAVIVVGDIDAAAIEEKVKSIFSEIPLRKNLPERPVFDVPLGADFTYLPIKDKELGAPLIEYYIKHKTDTSLTQKEEIKNELKYQLLSSIFSQRLQEQKNSTSNPLLSINFGISDVVRSLDALKITIQPKTDSILPALHFALTELKRFSLYGATEKEFERTKNSVTKSLQNDLQETKNNTNVFMGIALYKAFFNKSPLPDKNWKINYQLSCLKDMQNQDLLDYFKEYDRPVGNVLAIEGSDEVHYPTKEEVLKVIENARNSHPEPYVEKVYNTKLMTLNLPGGTVISSKKLNNINAKTYLLSNGARVTLVHQSNEKGRVYFQALSPGGLSVLDKKLLSNAMFTPMLASESGLANLNKTELRKASGINLVEVKINEYDEQLIGTASDNNLEALFKGIYMTFTKPRFDDSELEAVQQNLKLLLATLKSMVQSDFSDSLQLAKTNYSDRKMILNDKLIEDLSMPTAETIYRNRISNAADFDFVFLGDFDSDNLLKFVTKYIGSIPGNDAPEQPIDHHMKPPLGINTLHMSRAMTTPQASVYIYLTGNLPYTLQNKKVMAVIEELLSKRYMERIREQEGGTYGVRVRTDMRHLPEDSYEINISFNGNPEKTERLVEIVYEELKNLEHQVNINELLEVKKNLKKSITDSQKYNRYWLEMIVDHIQNNVPITSVEDDLKNIDAVSQEDIKRVMVQINTDPRVVEGILSPEKE